MLLIMNYVTHSGLAYVTYYELCYSIRTLYMLLIMNYVTQSGL
jgi:hypothetical protein